jgi:hypothetical protein
MGAEQLRKIDETASAVNKSAKADRVQRLAAQLLADRQRPERADTSNFNRCFLCQRSFVYRPATGDDSGRFCCPDHRQQYDDGKRAVTYSRRQQFQMRQGKVGFWITCRCGRTFESKGWAHCSVECQRQAHLQAEAASIRAEVNMEAPTKRRCQKAGCTRSIPNWRRGRRTPRNAKFCDLHSGTRKKGTHG